MQPTVFCLSLREQDHAALGRFTAMNLLNCHGEERSDVAIHLDLLWIAAVG
jgi:hypothetical protein